MSHWHAASGSDDGSTPPITGASRSLQSATALGVVSAAVVAPYGDAADTTKSAVAVASTAVTANMRTRMGPPFPHTRAVRHVWFGGTVEQARADYQRRDDTTADVFYDLLRYIAIPRKEQHDCLCRFPSMRPRRGPHPLRERPAEGSAPAPPRPLRVRAASRPRRHPDRDPRPSRGGADARLPDHPGADRADRRRMAPESGIGVPDAPAAPGRGARPGGAVRLRQARLRAHGLRARAGRRRHRAVERGRRGERRRARRR